ncbi:YIP1 family protein [bacterium]|nr:YIP1 family protein [bacterium]
MKVSRKEQVARIERFASLWNRLVSSYLNRDTFEDIGADKESDFLALQGSIMQELGAVAELEEGRFTLVEEVTSVINEAISLRHLKNQSEFQCRRRKERGRQVSELIANVKRFVAERDTTAIREEKELEEKISRPFWDPEKGDFGRVLGRIVAFPGRFFSSVRVAGEAKEANGFLLLLLSLLSAGCIISVTVFNASTARAISRNFALETGILSSDASAAAKIVIWLLLGAGVAVASLAGAVVAAILAHLLAILTHIGFKIVGGKGDGVASHKVVVFGLAPVLLLILVPIVAHFVGKGNAPSSLLFVVMAVTALYVAVLHVVGFHNVHKGPVAAGAAGWLIGVVLFVGIILGILWMWHFSAGHLPPSSGEYVYVTAREAPMFRGKQRVQSVTKGEILDFLEEKGDFYLVQHGKSKVGIKKSDAELREGSISSLPKFLLENSAARAEVLIDRLSRRIRD